MNVKGKVKWIVSGMVLALLAQTGWAGDAKALRFATSGWSVPSSEADLDESGGGGFHSHLIGKGTHGKVEITNLGDLADWDGVSYCDFDPDSGQPRGILLNYIGVSSVLVFKNGDRLELNQDSSPPSTLCFDFVDNASFTLEVHSVIVGGSGRYAGASGNIVNRGVGRNIGGGMSSFSMESDGHVRVPRK